MLPWCQDEKDEALHNDFIKMLASMDSKTRKNATKHAVAAAEVLLRARKQSPDKNAINDIKMGDRLAEWHK